MTLIVGVNGTGKTTTIGKLANLLKASGQAAARLRGRHVPRRGGRAARDLGQARAASTSCARRTAPIPPPSCSTRSSRARRAGAIPILVDTAGRLHNRVNLMNELDKIRRVAARAAEGAPHEVLLVLDATVGQNGVQQAREFTSVAGVTGIVLTKLDGTAKGGVAVAIAHDLKLPIRYVGVGEGIDDLIPFSAQEYVDACSRRSGRRRRGGCGGRSSTPAAASAARRPTRVVGACIVTAGGRRRRRRRARARRRAARRGPRARRSGRRARAAPRCTARSSRAPTPAAPAPAPSASSPPASPRRGGDGGSVPARAAAAASRALRDARHRAWTSASSRTPRRA